MNELHILCEGQTEGTFVSELLAPMLNHSTFRVYPKIVETSPGRRGGGLDFKRAQNFVWMSLTANPRVTVTSLIDLYGLNADFPGFNAAQGKSELAAKLKILTEAWHKEVAQKDKTIAQRFIPYIQPHEFEALVFSNLTALSTLHTEWEEGVTKLASILKKYPTPEHVNTVKEKTPSYLLENKLPKIEGKKYKKTTNGIRAIELIGIANVEKKCEHFATWLARLRKCAEFAKA